jgi:transcription elongation GreA/GreB family factor
MSRAFVKENDGTDFAEDLPERPVSRHPNIVTERGLRLIEEALAAERQALAAGQKAKDRTAIARASRELRYWQARRATARLAPAPEDLTIAGFGAIVTLEDEDGNERRFGIVGEDEADPAEGLISWISPMARSLAGKGEGDEVIVAGHRYTIAEVAYP